jgi:osmoprotectant transport system permease protein
MARNTKIIGLLGIWSAAVFGVACAEARDARATEHVVVGSKAFPESWILAEAMAKLASAAGAEVEHRENLGGTEIVAQAVRSGAIDAYPDYTGTLREVVLHAPSATVGEIRLRLADEGLGVTDSLGFDDSYALALSPRAPDAIRSVSDAAKHPELRAAFSHEFLGRQDGWPGLQRRYGLAFRDVRGVEHHLAFEALAGDSADVTDVYTTDPQIEVLRLRVLADDLSFFPRYEAVIVYRLDVAARAPKAWEAILRLVGRVDRAGMARANTELAVAHRSLDAAASSLLRDALNEAPTEPAGGPPLGATVLRALTRHVALVAASLAVSAALGIPLGVLAARRRTLAIVVLGGASLLQTIPSLALLALLIPILGIGTLPAAVTLILYGLLPIVQGTCTGITAIPAPLAESAEAFGLTPVAKLLRLELPLASPTIVAGVRTSAVIAVGTATIAALVGAGGLGELILQGITLRSGPLILAGAVPAAVLALAIQGAFAAVERVVVPRGMRIRTHAE